MNIGKINTLEFWEQYPDIILLPIDGYHYLSSEEAGIILEGYKLTFTDNIYQCDKTRLILTVITDNGKPPEIENSFTLFLPLEFLITYI